jgi:hypothetical protein
MFSEKLLTITLVEITDKFPYTRADATELSEEDSITLCQEVTRDIEDMLQWYETIDKTSSTYDTFQSIDYFRVDIEETGLIVTFCGDHLQTHDLFEELAIAIGEGILHPTSEVTLSEKRYEYMFQLL